MMFCIGVRSKNQERGSLMKRLLCKFANWILRRYTESEIAFGTDVYINGRTYKLIQATSDIYPYGNKNITFEVQY